MPTYEYECSDCGHRFEAFQKISDAPLEACPVCSKSVRRLISAGLGIIFKGSGFYSTDSKKSQCAALSSKDTSSSAPKADSPCKSCPKAQKTSA